MGSAFDLNALSGINAAANGLGVISNNLANSQSIGFKSSRAEFSDMFSGAQNSPGNGVRVAAITQNFSQGTINGTGRELDMAIDGNGFFILEDKTGKYDNIYTRNGSFKLDKDGYLTAQDGSKVQGFLLNEALSTEADPVFYTTLSSIDLDALSREPRATDQMNFDINLDGQEVNSVGNNNISVGNETAGNLDKLTNPDGIAGVFAGFPNFSTNKIIHDSLGGEHRLTANFYKRDVVTQDLSTMDSNGIVVVAGSADAVKHSSWMVQYSVQSFNEVSKSWEASGHTESATAGSGTADKGMLFELRFDTNGKLIDVRNPSAAAVAAGANSNPVGQDVANTGLPDADWATLGQQATMAWVLDTPLTGANDPLGNTSANNVSIALDFNEMTQFAGSYNLRGVTQNGFQIGDLVGLSTSPEGMIEARYSNGRSIPVAQLGMGNFSDKNALEKLGGMTYAETFSSGALQLGKAQENGFGSIQSGSLEFSNVDMTAELVNMIQTQRTYQASAQVLSTSQTLTQTILNL